MEIYQKLRIIDFLMSLELANDRHYDSNADTRNQS